MIHKIARVKVNHMANMMTVKITPNTPVIPNADSRVMLYNTSDN